MRNANLLRITTTPATLYVIRNHRGFSFAHRFLWQCHLVSAFAVAEREGPYSSIAPTDMILRTRSITSIVARHWTVVPYHPGGARYMSHPLTHPLDLSTLDITCVIAKGAVSPCFCQPVAVSLSDLLSSPRAILLCSCHIWVSVYLAHCL